LNSYLAKPEPARKALLLGAICTLWLALSSFWVFSDKLVRDGDEEGHVGAAELFRGDLAQHDWLGFLARLSFGQMGEYPQAFAAGIGAWWWAVGSGAPDTTLVRSICLLSLLLTALATGRIARRYVEKQGAGTAEIITVIAVLALPLGNGLTRHFMPEAALMAAVALALLAAHRLVERPTIYRGLQLGLALGLGLLTKQTFALLIFVPILVCLGRPHRSNWRPLAVSALVTTAIAGPWWIANAAAQTTYAGASIQGAGNANIWGHLAFYPSTLLGLGLGPGLIAVTLIALFGPTRSTKTRGLIFASAWLLGGMLILVLIPKKYPRLIAPLMPAVPLLIGIGWTRLDGLWKKISSTGLALSFIWLGLGSTQHFGPTQAKTLPGDPGCPQIWLRAPSRNDLGLSRVAAMLEKHPAGAVLLFDDPDIPCAIQTTHNWGSHLGPYLRRSGSDREIHTDPARPHRFVLSFVTHGGDIQIEDLGLELRIRDTLKP